MPLVVKCDCGKQMRVPDEHRGKRFKCPACGAGLVAGGDDKPAPAASKTPAAPAGGGIAFACKCGKKLQVKAEHAGKTLKCPQCGEALRVPTPGGAAPTRKAEPSAPVKKPAPPPDDDEMDADDDLPLSKRLEQKAAQKKAAARQEEDDEDQDQDDEDQDQDDTSSRDDADDEDDRDEEEEQPKKGKAKKGKKKGGSLAPLLVLLVLLLGGGGAAAWYFDYFGLLGDNKPNKPIPTGPGQQVVIPPMPTLPSAFTLVPANAEAFATLRVADLLATDLGKELLAQLPPDGQYALAFGEGKLGLTRNDIERVTVVVPSVEQAIAAARSAGAGGPNSPPDVYAIITTTKPLDAQKILQWPELQGVVTADHNGKPIHTRGPVAFHFDGDMTVVIGTPNAVRKAIDQGMRPPAEGPLTPLLAQAEQPLVSLGTFPPAAHLAALKGLIPEEFKALGELTNLQLNGNVEGTTVQLTVTGGFGTDANAGQVKTALEKLKAQVAQNPPLTKDIPPLLLEHLKGLTVAQEGSNATLAASVPVDVKAIAARIKESSSTPPKPPVTSSRKPELIRESPQEVPPVPGN